MPANQGPQHPAITDGTASATLQILEQAGVDVYQFLYQLRTNPHSRDFARQFARDACFLPFPPRPNAEGLDSLIRGVLGARDELPAPWQEVYDFFGSADGLEPLIESLTSREITLVVLRYGLSDGVRIATKDIARILGVNTDSVRRIEARIMSKLHQASVRQGESRIRAVAGRQDVFSIHDLSLSPRPTNALLDAGI